MKINLPLTNHEEFLKDLQKKELESVQLIKSLEKNLKELRGFIIKPPKKGESVVLMFSGGVDSVVICALLLEVYQVHVYPFFGDGGLIGRKRAIQFFDKYFKKRYPDLFHSPFIFHQDEQRQINNIYRQISFPHLSATEVLEKVNLKTGEIMLPEFTGRSSLFTYQAMAYVAWLENQGLKINSIICGVLAEDGQTIPSQTQTFIRHMNTNLLFFTKNKNLQHFSLAFEKELGHAWQKPDLVKMGQKLKLPLEKTHSCDRNFIWHCGQCSSCLHRHWAFNEARARDKTFYFHFAWERLTVLAKNSILKARNLFNRGNLWLRKNIKNQLLKKL